MFCRNDRTKRFTKRQRRAQPRKDRSEPRSTMEDEERVSACIGEGSSSGTTKVTFIDFDVSVDEKRSEDKRKAEVLMEELSSSESYTHIDSYKSFKIDDLGDDSRAWVTEIQKRLTQKVGNWWRFCTGEEREDLEVTSCVILFGSTAQQQLPHVDLGSHQLMGAVSLTPYPVPTTLYYKGRTWTIQRIEVSLLLLAVVQNSDVGIPLARRNTRFPWTPSKNCNFPCQYTTCKIFFYQRRCCRRASNPCRSARGVF